MRPTVVLAPLALLTTGLTAAQQRPNVLVYLMDDVGRDKVAVYGDSSNPAPTPNIDAFAGRGVLFRSAWAYAACSPTRAALLTGRHADRTGIGVIIRPNDGVQTPLDPAEVILPEALPEYWNIALGKWHLRDSQSPMTHVLDCGFDTSVGYAGFNDFYDWDRLVNGVVEPRSGYYPVSLTEDTIGVLRRMPEPYFAYVCPKMAHSPYHDPPDSMHTQGDPTSDRDQHVAMVEALDTLFGRLMHFVDLENTYVFVIGDNGSPGATIFPPYTAGRVKGSLYEGGVRVPFIVAGPGVERGAECDELVHVTDVFATVLELTGSPPASGFAEDSISFAPLLADADADGARDSLYVTKFPFPGTTGQHQDAVRTKRYKLIRGPSATAFELYDLSIDPLETTNLLLSNPGPATDALRDRLERMIPIFP